MERQDRFQPRAGDANAGLRQLQHADIAALLRTGEAKCGRPTLQKQLGKDLALKRIGPIFAELPDALT